VAGADDYDECEIQDAQVKTKLSIVWRVAFGLVVPCCGNWRV
jgi:hypothetical protein